MSLIISQVTGLGVGLFVWWKLCRKLCTVDLFFNYCTITY